MDLVKINVDATLTQHYSALVLSVPDTNDKVIYMQTKRCQSLIPEVI